MKRSRPLLLAAAVAVAIAAVLAFERSRGPSAPKTAAAQIASFAAAPTSSSMPSSAERQRFITAFSHGPPSLLASLDLAHVRRFSEAGFSLVAAPTKTGGICYLDSTSGGGCIESSGFKKGSGFSLGYRRTGADNQKHNVITGLVPDGFVKIAFRSGTASASAPVRDNVFQFIVPPALYGGVDSYSLIRADGSEHTEPIDL